MRGGRGERVKNGQSEREETGWEGERGEVGMRERWGRGEGRRERERERERYTHTHSLHTRARAHTPLH